MGIQSPPQLDQPALLKQMGRGLAGALVPPQPKASEVLLNLQITQSIPLMNNIEEPLANLGFALKTGSIQIFGATERKYTLAVRGETERALLYIPRWILDDLSMDNHTAIFSLPYNFPHTDCFIFSDAGLDEPDWFYLGILENVWPTQFGVHAWFIAWRHVQGLGNAATPQEQEGRLKGMLKLSAVDPAAQAAPQITKMDLKEKQELVRVLAGLADFSTPRDRRGMINLAGLGTILSNFDFTGQPTTVAGELVGRLQHYGEMPGQPGYHALGMLLDYLTRLPDFPRDEKETLEGVISKYQLVP